MNYEYTAQSKGGIMRVIFVVLYLVLFFIITLPIYLVEYILGKVNRKWKVKSSQAIVAFNFKRILNICGTKVTVKGIENVPKKEAVLYVSNHRGFADIPVVYTTVPTMTGFVAKKEMIKIPFLSWWMKSINCLFLDRDNIKEGLKTILQGIDLIKDGYSIFIAPEGTRNQGNKLLPFKEGSIKMAEKTGCAIIPIALSNTDAVFERQAPWVKKAHVVIEYGTPIYIKDLEKEQKKRVGAYVQGIIQEMLDRNQSLI